MSSFTQIINQLNRNIKAFFSFIGMKLKNFKNLTWGEQISYCCVGLGIVLILISVVLFII